MTNRYNALTVTLARDIRDDDAEPLIAAISHPVPATLRHLSGIVVGQRSRDRKRRRINCQFIADSVEETIGKLSSVRAEQQCSAARRLNAD